MNSPILEPILVVGLGSSLGNPAFAPWPSVLSLMFSPAGSSGVSAQGLWFGAAVDFQGLLGMPPAAASFSNSLVSVWTTLSCPGFVTGMEEHGPNYFSLPGNIPPGPNTHISVGYVVGYIVNLLQRQANLPVGKT